MSFLFRFSVPRSGGERISSSGEKTATGEYGPGEIGSNSGAGGSGAKADFFAGPGTGCGLGSLGNNFKDSISILFSCHPNNLVQNLLTILVVLSVWP